MRLGQFPVLEFNATLSSFFALRFVLPYSDSVRMVYHEQGSAWICEGQVLRDDYRNTEQDTVQKNALCCFWYSPMKYGDGDSEKGFNWVP